jgi:aryl sulfotransferase
MLRKDVKPIWLASYPKSGNTWVSLFLSVLMEGGALNINEQGFDAVISSRTIIDNLLGINSSQLPESDYLKYRSILYNKWAENFSDRNYLICKVHDACIREEVVLFPQFITRGVVYILRNPFDMAASLANHKTISIDNAVNQLCSNDTAMADRKTSLNNQLSQFLGTWANHVASWENIHTGNILLIKYEDLVAKGFSEFKKIVEYIGLRYSDPEIELAIAKTAFENLQQQEKAVKFCMTPEVSHFFRSGRIGGWRNEITQKQVDRIITSNYDALLKYDYIDTSGNILV